MKNKIIMLLVSAMLVITLSACDEKTSGFVSGGTKDSSSTEKKIETEEVEEIEEQDKEELVKEEIEDKEKDSEDIEQEEKVAQSIKVYFTDDQAESLVEKQIDVNLAKGETLEMKVLQSLKSKPEDANTFNAVEESIQFNSVKVEEKIAHVDISSEGLQGSSIQEAFLKDSIVAALTSLDTVDGVKFLVDGIETDTLMGHLEVSGVLTKDSVQTNIIK